MQRTEAEKKIRITERIKNGENLTTGGRGRRILQQMTKPEKGWGGEVGGGGGVEGVLRKKGNPKWKC